MNYIYDIVLNFNYIPYDIYEWNLSDNLICIKKIPCFKIGKKSYLDICNCTVKVEPSFLTNIKLKTEVFNQKTREYINYACLFMTDEEVIGCQFNNEGYIINKSNLLYDEEDEILSFVELSKPYNLPYHIIKKKSLHSFKTRNELEREIYIKNELKQLIENKEYNKIRYLYYECFNQKVAVESTNSELLINQIITQIDKVFDKIYSFLTKCFLK